MADIISAAIASSLEITSDSKSTPVPFIGDFLISFSSSERTFPGRNLTSKWQRDLAEADWQIWKQAPSQTWKGYPLTHFRSDPWKLWLLGEFYGLTAGNVSPNQRLTEFIQHGFSGKDLNGHFLLFGWNGDTKEWHVWTDRFGTLHAYYTIGNHESAIGTFFPSVASLASPRRLNWSGLTGFFSFGFFPQDHTHFEGVRIFRPASHYLFDQKGILLSRKPYWEWWYEPDNRRSLRDSTAQFHTVINEIMNEQTGSGRVAIPISGGLDSRTTVAAFGRVAERTDQNRIWSYSYGYSDDSVETKIARKVASARGLDFQSFTIGPYLFDQMGVVLRAVEGVQDLTQCRQAAVREETFQARRICDCGTLGRRLVGRYGGRHKASSND